MAAVTGPIIAGCGDEDGSIKKCTWTLTSADPTGVGVSIPEWSDRTWHVNNGTIGGATLTVESAATDTDADYAACKNAAGGAAIGITAVPGIATNIENSLFIRPRLNPVGSGASVVVTLIARRGNNMRQ